MPEMRRKLAERLLSTDWGTWNRPQRAKLLAPVFALVGGLLGVLLQVVLAHREYEPLPGGLVTGVFVVGALIAGLVVLAWVD